MNAKMGRPTDNPKNIMIRVRMDEETVKTMDECAKQLNTTRSEIIRTGIKKVYADLEEWFFIKTLDFMPYINYNKCTA